MIELVMTIVIVGILAVVAMGRLDFTSVFQQRGVYDKVKAGLEFARKAAVAKRRCVQVTVNGGTVSFLYDSNSPETAGVNCAGSSFAAGNYLTLPAADTDCPSGGHGNVVCSHSGGTIAGATTFTFDATGGASAAATLSVTSPGLSADTITVESQTGYVH
jgi:MSHA pilin protein MshC